MHNGVTLSERDFFDDRFSERELRDLISGRSPSDVFSWKSPSFRKLRIARESLCDYRLVAMMLDEPRFIRRPLVQVGDELIVGADIVALSRVLT